MHIHTHCNIYIYYIYTHAHIYIYIHTYIHICSHRDLSMIHSIQTHHCRTEMPNASPTESQGCNGNPQKDEKVISIWIGFCFSIILRGYWLLLYHHMLPSFQKCTLFGYSSPDACQAENQPCNHHSAEVFLPRLKCLIRVEFGKAKNRPLIQKQENIM